MKILRVLIVIAVGLTGLTGLASAQEFQWDYEAYPWIPVEYRHLDAEIRLNDNGLIEGDILYTLAVKDEQADSLILDAPGAEILTAEVQNEQVNNYMDGDRLVIYLNEKYRKGDELTLRIRYRSVPDFGVHKSPSGLFFTSNLPKTTSHWIPVTDHPAVEFTAEIMFTHPASKRLVMNGRRGETSVVNVDEEMTVYSMNRAVSATGLNWVVGDLNMIASTEHTDWQQNSGPELQSLFLRRSDSQIHLYSEYETDLLDEILSVAAETFQFMQTETGITYPFRDLQIVLLRDGMWETKSYGSGTIYLYENRGDLVRQVRQSVVSQWIGAKLRERTWSDPDAILLLKSHFISMMTDQLNATEHSPDPYNAFDNRELDRWLNLHQSIADTIWDNRMTDAVSELFRSGLYILEYNDLAKIIYNNSGVPYFSGFDPEMPDQESSEEIVYLAEISLEEGSGTLQIKFEALSEAVDELVNVTAVEQSVSGRRTHDLTFTGSEDTIVLSVSSSIENLTLELTDREDMILSVEKPFQFWIYQLQNSGDINERKEAASALSRFSGNPDLQLALTDLLRMEENPEVMAEILRSVSVITNGASGTEQLFLDRTNNQNELEVRLAAVESLALYSGNDSVISRLRSVLNQAGESSIRKAAIRSLFETTEPDRFLNVVESVITDERFLDEVPLMLELLAQKGEEETAVRFGSTFLSDSFPFSIRKPVLDLILELDQSREGWSGRLPALLSDTDPRIRYYSVAAIDRVDSSTGAEWIERRMAEEYDERVRQVLVRNR
jgi:hypothetical protein